MGDLSNKTCLVYDYGWNINLARRLSREFGRVRYFKPWKSNLPESETLCVGDGFEEIERVRDFFTHDVLNHTDLFVFPEIYDGDLQTELVRQGKRVWGSRMGERLEYNRELFSQTLKKVGLPTIEHAAMLGIDELEAYLGENDDQWVKMNLRGDDETWRHYNLTLSRNKLTAMRHKWGPLAKFIKFTVYAHVECDTEAAYDGFMITAQTGKPQFTDYGFLGYEHKNQSHILTALPYDDFPDGVREVNDLFAPELAKYWFRSAWGTEIKITDEGENLFLDATCRQPDPPGEIIMEMVSNLGELFYYGSEGENVPLKIEEPFGVQVFFYSEWSQTNWSTIEVPKEIDRWAKFGRCFREGNLYQVTPRDPVTADADGIESIGSMVAIGSTIEEAIDKVKEYCGEIKSTYLTDSVESLAEVLKRIHEGEEEGIEFGKMAVPPPEIVLSK